MSALNRTQIRSVLVAPLALVALLAMALAAPEADAIGIGPSGNYSFGDSDCNEGSRSDPVGVLFRGKRGSAHRARDEIMLHTNWDHDVAKNQYLFTLQSNGGYKCEYADYSVASAADVPPAGRYHTRLWFIHGYKWHISTQDCWHSTS